MDRTFSTNNWNYNRLTITTTEQRFGKLVERLFEELGTGLKLKNIVITNSCFDAVSNDTFFTASIYYCDKDDYSYKKICSLKKDEDIKSVLKELFKEEIEAARPKPIELSDRDKKILDYIDKIKELIYND